MNNRRLARAILGSLLLAMAAVTPASAEWRRAETKGFIVYSDGDAGVLRDNALQLELFESALRFLHGTNPSVRAPKKISIYLVANHNGLSEVWPDAPETVAGFYRPSDDEIFAVAIRDRRNLDTLLHEYAHHFMMGSFGAGYPAWFVEGYAEYFMTAELSPRRIMIGNYNRGRAEWLEYSRWLPLSDVVTNRPGQYRDGNAVAMYYAQSWLLTHWLMSDPTRMRQMLAYFAKLKVGMSSVAALEEATGMSITEIERALKAYSRGRLLMRGFSSEQFPAAEATITNLSTAESALLLLSLRLSNTGDNETENTALLSQIRNRTQAFPNDPFAQRLLARAEIRIGDRSAGETIAQQLMADAPSDPDILRLLAEERIKAANEEGSDRAARMGEARRYLARAFAEDDTDFRTLYMLSKTRREAPGFPNDNDMDTLLLAVSLAPQIPTIRFAAAQAHASRSEYAQAILLLEPMAANPHGDHGSAIARAMIARLKTNDEGDPAETKEAQETSGDDPDVNRAPG